MDRTKNWMKAIKRIGLLSGAALIAISASAIPGPVASAAAPAASQQVAEQPQWQHKKHQGGQGGQTQRQWSNRQTGQQWRQHNGQRAYRQGGQGQRQWTNRQTQYWQQGKQHNGQGIYRQGRQWQNNGQQWSGGHSRQWSSQRQWQQQPGQRHRFSWSSYVPGHRPPQWERYRHSFNPHDYRWNRYAEHRYYWHHYVAPQGWYYRRWSYGEVLPPVFWGRQYWLTGYWNFGLIDPPYGYVWVRYGDDALLIDVASGQILSVEYGVFYS